MYFYILNVFRAFSLYYIKYTVKSSLFFAEKGGTYAESAHKIHGLKLEIIYLFTLLPYNLPRLSIFHKPFQIANCKSQMHWFWSSDLSDSHGELGENFNSVLDVLCNNVLQVQGTLRTKTIVLMEDLVSHQNVWDKYP